MLHLILSLIFIKTLSFLLDLLHREVKRVVFHLLNSVGQVVVGMVLEVKVFPTGTSPLVRQLCFKGGGLTNAMRNEQMATIY